MVNFKYKLKEITPDNTPDGINVGDIKTGSGVKTTVTDIDSETGAVSWDVKYVPNIEKLVDDVNDLTKTAKEVAVKTKEDSKFLDIYEKSKELRNIIRTHVRNQYPEEYKKIMEIDLDEMSMSGGGSAGASFTPGTGAQYATPFAFKLKKKQTDEGVGATLGLGPSASEDGVKDNAYVKQFKYKLVPKTKQGTYVQKGSGLEVKQLFKEEKFPQSSKSYQQERMLGFDRVEDLLGQINPLLKDAKLETEKYYQQNPQSYGVVYGTDLIVDYLNDILNILKEKE
tara:strand:+ start:1704 stop:2552 length:849 start_codon:yes stop_codon:yes gene_type:complete